VVSVQRFQEFLKRLFSLRNVAPLLIITGAIIGSLGIKPFGVSFTSEQIIMALLAFLAIDALVERLELLTNIEQGVQFIQKTLKPTVTSEAFFKKRDSRRVETLIDQSRGEIWVAGITLDTMVTLVETFRTKLKEGCKIRFLALTPDGVALQEMAKYFGSDPNFVAARIKSNLGVLASRLKRVPNGSIEIRTLDSPFTTGYVISDPSSPKGHMVVQFYTYWLGVDNSPLFELAAQEDKQWFPIYLRQYEKAWTHATEYDYQTSSLPKNVG